MIPNETIDRILDKVDIVELISAYLPLKKAGQSFKACCPFHEEKTPSFVVSHSKQIYHCFGCGAGGNAIGFLMKHERMEFIEAITMLSEKANIQLPRYTKDMKAKDSLADKLYGVNNVACSFYQENLKTNNEAHKYFTDRGIDENTVRTFKLGFAEDLWQGLIHYCNQKKIESGILEKAGLILQSAGSQNKYDRFRNRIIFPIFDLRNRVLGFGARALDNSLPKYINSPETYIYKKGRQLYGLNFSRDFIRKQNYAIIVEGYFDLIIPFKNGIKNIVATLGTALTTEHISLLKRFTKNVIMVYDSDKAGEAATLRSLDTLIEEGMNIRVAILPKGLDPDGFVRKEGKAGLMDLLKKSKDLFDYKLGTLTAKYKKTEPRGKARIVAEMLPTLAKIKSAVLRSSYLKKMSEELSVDEESVRTELKDLKPGFTRSPNKTQNNERRRPKSPTELTLLSIALEDKNITERIKEEIGIDHFKDESIINLFKKINELHENGKKIAPSHLMSYFEDDNRIEQLVSEAVSIRETLKDTDKVLNDCIRSIRKENLKSTLDNIQFKIKEAESAADSNRVSKLIAEYNDLIKASVARKK